MLWSAMVNRDTARYRMYLSQLNCLFPLNRDLDIFHRHATHQEYIRFVRQWKLKIECEWAVFTLLGNDDARYCFGNAGSCCQECDAHYWVWNFQCVSCATESRREREGVGGGEKGLIWFHSGVERSRKPYRRLWSSMRPNTIASQSIWCTWEMWAETISWNDFAHSWVWSMQIECVSAKL